SLDNDIRQTLVNQLDDEVQQRYQAYRTATLHKGTMKKLLTALLDQTPANTLIFVMAGLGKVFVGEIVEMALRIKKQQDDENDTPLRPEHLREAYRQYR
ncbi:TAFII28-like protein, partial [Ramicandelaber brevisporus]